MNTILPSSALSAEAELCLFSPHRPAVPHTGGIMQPWSLGDWSISCSIVSSRVRNAETCPPNSFFYVAESYSTVFICHRWFVHPCANMLTHCFSMLVLMNTVVVTMNVPVPCLLGIQAVQLYAECVNMIMMCDKRNREGFAFDSSRCSRSKSDSWITWSFCV